MQPALNHTQVQMNATLQSEHMNQQRQLHQNRQPQYYSPNKQIPPPQPIISSQQSQIQEIQYGPSCFFKVLMFPIPFFSIGCCVTQTTILQFDKKLRTGRLHTYPGACSPCGEQQNFNFQNISKVGLKKGYATQKMKNMKQQPYVLIFCIKEKQYQLTGNKGITEAKRLLGQLKVILARCQIQCPFQQPQP